MKYHPDRNPGDAHAARMMAEINDALDQINGWAVALLEAIAGSGKTREFARATARGQYLYVAIAAPTIDLLEEIRDWLTHFKCRTPIAIIHSGQHATRSVQERIAKWFEAQMKERHPTGVLAITQAALLEMDVPETANHCHLICDEVIDTAAFEMYALPRRYAEVAYLVAPEPYREGVYKLVPRHHDPKRHGERTPEQRLQTIAKNAPPDMFDTPFKPLAAAIIDPFKLVLCAQARWDDLFLPYEARAFSGQLDVLSVINPTRFRPWRDFSIMGAFGSTSLTCVLWRRLFNQRFSEHPLQPILPVTHDNGWRLKILWFFEEKSTRTFLAQQSTEGVSMQAAMCQSVAKFFGDQPFLWSLPQPGDGEKGVKDKFWNRGRGPAFLPSLRLDGKSLGQNQWRDHTRLALLSVVNWTPAQYELLGLLDLTADEIDTAHGLHTLYQDLTRSNIRDPRGIIDVIPIVPCSYRANFLAGRFPGCEVNRMPMELIPQVATKRKRGPKPSGHAASAAERKRKQRANDRALASPPEWQEAAD